MTDHPERPALLNDDILGGVETVTDRPGDVPLAGGPGVAAPRSSPPSPMPPPGPSRQVTEREPVRTDRDELFDLDGEQAPIEGNTYKVGLLGGKQVGKSYLFQSMVYRTHGRDMGALSYYLSRTNVRVYGRRYFDATSDATADEKFRPIKSHLLIEEYQRWDRLGTTARTAQMWSSHPSAVPFRLDRPEALRYGDPVPRRLGRPFPERHSNRGRPQVVDRGLRRGEGDRVLSADVGGVSQYKALSDHDVVEREGFLKHFYGVVHTYEELRTASGADHPVRVIIALTQADSPLCDGNTQRAWITPYVRNPKRYLRQLRTGGGVARYLASARAVSQHLCEIAIKRTNRRCPSC